MQQPKCECEKQKPFSIGVMQRVMGYGNYFWFISTDTVEFNIDKKIN